MLHLEPKHQIPLPHRKRYSEMKKGMREAEKYFEESIQKQTDNSVQLKFYDAEAIDTETIQEKPIANVRIVSEGATAAVYLDGKKVNGLIGYEIVHDRTKAQKPIIRLNLQSKLDIETGMIPELPEPYTYFYPPIK